MFVTKFTCFYQLYVLTKFNCFQRQTCNVLDVLWLVRDQPLRLVTPSVVCVSTFARGRQESTAVSLNAAGTVVSGNLNIITIIRSPQCSPFQTNYPREAMLELSQHIPRHC